MVLVEGGRSGATESELEGILEQRNESDTQRRLQRHLIPPGGPASIPSPADDEQRHRREQQQAIGERLQPVENGRRAPAVWVRPLCPQRINVDTTNHPPLRRRSEKPSSIGHRSD